MYESQRTACFVVWIIRGHLSSRWLCHCTFLLTFWLDRATRVQQCEIYFPTSQIFLFYSWGIFKLLCSSTFSLSLACSPQRAVPHMLQHYSTCVLVHLGPYGVAAVATETGRKWVHHSTRCLDARAESWCMCVVCFLLTHSLGIKPFKHGDDVFTS